eukprot:12644106-Alexandrium_andersonii.AAC.1
MEHADLWRLIGRAISARGEPTEWFRVQKVPAHCKAEHVQAGILTFTEWQMSAGADRLAVAGAAQHAVPER